MSFPCYARRRATHHSALRRVATTHGHRSAVYLVAIPSAHPPGCAIDLPNPSPPRQGQALRGRFASLGRSPSTAEVWQLFGDGEEQATESRSIRSALIPGRLR